MSIATGSLAAQQIAPDRSSYLAGAPMTVRYTTPPDDGSDSRPWIGIFRPGEDARLDWKFVPQKGRGELAFQAPAEVGDFEVRLFLLRDETQFSRAPFATEVTPVRGALGLSKTTFAAGEPVTVSVSLPDNRFYRNPWVGLFRLGLAAEGGAVLADNRLEYKHTDLHSPLTFTAPAWPGRYAFRVFDRDDWFYILDTIEFEVEVRPTPGALALTKKKYVVGEPMTVTVNLPADRYYGNAWVGLFRADEAIAQGGAGLDRERLTWERVGNGGPIKFTAPAWPGLYEFRVFDRDDWFYRLDAVAFEVEVTPVPGALALAKKKYVVGEPLEVTVTLPANRHYGNAWVGLFHADSAEPRGGGGFERNRLSWERVGNGGAIAFKAPAWPGEYEFRVFDRDDWHYRLDAIAFEVEVTPVPGALALTKKKYVVGEPMEVTVTLPPNRYYGNAWVGLFRADSAEPRGGGGFERNRLSWERVGNGGAIAFKAPAWPGEYEFRVFDRDDWHYRLDAIAFSVEVTPAPGALQLAKQQFIVGEPIAVNVTLPPNRFYGNTWIGLFRADATEPRGGSGIERNRITWERVGDGKDIAFKAPPWPGRYEFRVFDRDNMYYFLDAAGFDVVVTPAATLRPEKRHYAPGEEIRLLVDVPANRHLGSAWVGLYTTGHAVRGGATTGESRVTYWNVNSENPRLAFPAPQRAGPYELRFYDRSSEEYVLAIAPITVGSPLPGDAGRIVRLTPMPGAGSSSRANANTPDGAGLPIERPVVPGRGEARDPRNDGTTPDNPASDSTRDPAGVPTLRFLATSEGGFAPLSALGAGRTFLVEATFAEAPTEDTFPVDLTDDQGARQTVLVHRTDDPKVFRSGVVSIGGSN
jgi:hypothetical protein